MTKDDILRRIAAIMEETFEIDPAKVKPEARLYDDLEIDSIDAVDLIVQLKPLIGAALKPEAFKAVRTVADVVDVVHAMMHAGAPAPAGLESPVAQG